MCPRVLDRSKAPQSSQVARELSPKEVLGETLQVLWDRSKFMENPANGREITRGFVESQIGTAAKAARLAQKLGVSGEGFVQRLGERGINVRGDGQLEIRFEDRFPQLSEFEGVVQDPKNLEASPSFIRKPVPSRGGAQGQPVLEATPDMVRADIGLYDRLSSDPKHCSDVAERVHEEFKRQGLTSNDLKDHIRGEGDERGEKAGDTLDEILGTRQDYSFAPGGELNEALLKSEEKGKKALYRQLVVLEGRDAVGPAQRPEAAPHRTAAQDTAGQKADERKNEVRPINAANLKTPDERGLQMGLNMLTGAYEKEFGEKYKADPLAAPQIEALRGIYTDKQLLDRMNELFELNQNTVSIDMIMGRKMKGLPTIHLANIKNWHNDPAREQKTRVWDTLTNQEKEVLRPAKPEQADSPEQAFVVLLAKAQELKEKSTEHLREKLT